MGVVEKGDLKPETEALICAAQEQALRTNYIKHKIDHTREDDKCRMCGQKGETVWHITSECEKLAQREYKRRHDNVARIIHWELCGKYGIDRAKNWYEQKPTGVMENDKAKILWDFMIQCDKMIEHRKTEIVLVDKLQQKCLIIDVVCPDDNGIVEKEEEKLQRYDLLKREIKRLWRMKNIDNISIIVGTLGSITTELGKRIEQLNTEIAIEKLQKTTFLGTATILRKVLEIET